MTRLRTMLCSLLPAAALVSGILFYRLRFPVSVALKCRGVLGKWPLLLDIRGNLSVSKMAKWSGLGGPETVSGLAEECDSFGARVRRMRGLPRQRLKLRLTYLRNIRIIFPRATSF